MRPDGMQVERLTDDPAEDTDPSFSPNGRTIAFVSDRTDGVPRLHMMDIDGQNVRAVPNPPGERHQRPDWSPDGTRLALQVTMEDGGGVGPCEGRHVPGVGAERRRHLPHPKRLPPGRAHEQRVAEAPAPGRVRPPALAGRALGGVHPGRMAHVRVVRSATRYRARGPADALKRRVVLLFVFLCDLIRGEPGQAVKRYRHHRDEYRLDHGVDEREEDEGHRPENRAQERVCAQCAYR